MTSKVQTILLGQDCTAASLLADAMYKSKDLVISELCYKGIILQRNSRKMTILWSFSFNSFVKFHFMVIFL